MKLDNLKNAHTYTTREEVEYFIKRCVGQNDNYIIHDDLSVDVEGSVFISDDYSPMSYLPVKFNKVSENFVCSNLRLTSLRNSPRSVGRNFSVQLNLLTSLEGGPEKVGGTFSINENPVTSLEYAPREMDSLMLRRTKISSLKNIHKQIREIHWDIYLENKPMTNILGLMLVKGLQEVILDTHTNTKTDKAVKILNKHLVVGRDIHACQEEMLEAGLSEYAKL